MKKTKGNCNCIKLGLICQLAPVKCRNVETHSSNLGMRILKFRFYIYLPQNSPQLLTFCMSKDFKLMNLQRAGLVLGIMVL